MKVRHAIRVALALSYIFLVTGGKDARTTKQRENSSHILAYQQDNKTITVSTFICIIFFIEHSFY
jgi:hypothetical protein